MDESRHIEIQEKDYDQKQKALKAAATFGFSALREDDNSFRNNRLLTEEEKDLFERQLCLSSHDFWDVYILSFIKPGQLSDEEAPIFDTEVQELGKKHLHVGIRVLLGDLLHVDLPFARNGIRMVEKERLAQPSRFDEYQNSQSFLADIETQIVSSALLGKELTIKYKEVLDFLETVLEIEGRPNKNQQQMLEALNFILGGIRDNKPDIIIGGCSRFHQAIHTGGGTALRFLLSLKDRNLIVDLLIKQSAERYSPHFAYKGCSSKARKLFTRWAFVYERDLLEEARQNPPDRELASALIKNLQMNESKIKGTPLLAPLIEANSGNLDLITAVLNKYGVRRYLEETRISDKEPYVRVYSREVFRSGYVDERRVYEGIVNRSSRELEILNRYTNQLEGVRYKLEFESDTSAP